MDLPAMDFAMPGTNTTAESLVNVPAAPVPTDMPSYIPTPPLNAMYQPQIPVSGYPDPATNRSTPGSPIADLSYRSYDGPLKMRAVRWWIIAVTTMRTALRKPVFWIAVAMCLLTFLFQAVMLYFEMRLPAVLRMDPMTGEPAQIKFALRFFSAQCGQMNAFGQLLIALLVGAGSIAADNRANALLVYLSKPLSKSDYLLGKWMGIFLTIFLVTIIPGLIFFTYCALSFTGDEFFKPDPWLFGRMLVAATIAPAIHASAILGISAWSKSPSMAGASYTGLYLVGGLIVGILGGVMQTKTPDSPEQGVLVQHLSISGAIDGLTQNVYKVDLPHQVGRMQMRRGGGPPQMPQFIQDHPPTLWVMLAFAAAILVLGVVAARIKTQAVEVVS